MVRADWKLARTLSSGDCSPLLTMSDGERVPESQDMVTWWKVLEAHNEESIDSIDSIDEEFLKIFKKIFKDYSYIIIVNLWFIFWRHKMRSCSWSGTCPGGSDPATAAKEGILVFASDASGASGRQRGWFFVKSIFPTRG